MLYLLQSFDTVCKKHDIDYWLDYGTLLGAIRHQGFIPWDTDTDVGMLRSDYALFLEKGVPELPQDIFFQTPETEPAMAPWSWLVEARLRDRYSRYVPDKKTPAEPMQFGGLQLDLFIYDWDGKYENALSNSFERNLSESRIHLRLDEVEYLDTARFEGVEFPVPSGYDAYLTRCYGDYRTFPRKRKGKFRKWLPGRCNKMIDYVNKENMESVRGIENPGMMGEMGKIIGFYRLYRQTAEEEWEEKAEVLLDEVMENCSLELPVTYGDGLCGVGVGIEYLLQEGFVEGDADEILWQIDCRVFNTINSRAIGTLGIGKGICGLAYYLYYRLSRRKGEEDIKVLRMKEHLIYLIDWIADSLPGVRESSLFEEVFFILCLLHRLNVFNAKVEKLMEYCEKGMIISGKEAVWI